MHCVSRGPCATPLSHSAAGFRLSPHVSGAREGAPCSGHGEAGIRTEHRGYRAYATALRGRVLSVVLSDDLPSEPEPRFVDR